MQDGVHSVSTSTKFRARSLSLRISVTDKCQLSCRYCMPKTAKTHQPPTHYLTKDEIVRVVGLLQTQYTIQKIQFTGGDPLVRPDIHEIIYAVSNQLIPDISLTTNGQKLTRLAKTLKESGLNRINISLDSVNKKRFKSISKSGDLQKTLDGIEAAIANEIHPIKLNTVVMRGINDEELLDIAYFGLKRGCHVRFLELMPIGIASQHFDQWYISASEMYVRLSNEFHLTLMSNSCNSSSVNYNVVAPNGLNGQIGFISPYSQPFCKGCNRLRLTSQGCFVGCLKKGNMIDIRPFLQSESASTNKSILDAAETALSQKTTMTQTSHYPSFETREMMTAIGG